MKIKNITLIDNESLAIYFENPWQHEQINALADIVLQHLDNHRIIERVTGGDRQYIRFEWQQVLLHLEFEWYGQSVWLATELIQERELLKACMSALTPS